MLVSLLFETPFAPAVPTNEKEIAQKPMPNIVNLSEYKAWSRYDCDDFVIS
jgi:hypothetical protein